MTSGEAASHFFANVQTISPEAPDVSKLVEIAKQHQLTFAAPRADGIPLDSPQGCSALPGKGGRHEKSRQA
jgi:hypothetical protein